MSSFCTTTKGYLCAVLRWKKIESSGEPNIELDIESIKQDKAKEPNY